jgi:hypothetical protein
LSWKNLFDVSDISGIGGTADRQAVIMGWTWSDLSHEGIYYVAQFDYSTYGPEIGPIENSLTDRTLIFSIPIAELNLTSSDFAYSLQSRDANYGCPNTIVHGYTNNTYNGYVPIPSTLWLLGTGILGLTGFRSGTQKR